MIKPSEISRRLCQAAEARRMTQAEIADKAQLSQSTISLLSSMDDTGSPKLFTMLQIAEAIEVRPEWLICGAGPMDGEPEPEPKANSEAREIVMRQLRRLDEQAAVSTGKGQSVIAEAMARLYAALEGGREV